MDADARKKFDRQLVEDPQEKADKPDPGVLALMASARMPQASGGPFGSSTWSPQTGTVRKGDSS